VALVDAYAQFLRGFTQTRTDCGHRDLAARRGSDGTMRALAT
jgi:hypothetical protein